MTGRLPSGIIVSALLRRVHDSGGGAMVRASGDPHGGMILVVALDRGADPRLFERGIGPNGSPILVPVALAASDDAAVTAYWQRRRERDPDLWVVELDSPLAERFAAETILDG